MLRRLLVLFCVCVSATAAAQHWDKVILTEAAAKAGAVCLDGSPGGYFFRKGDPNKWIIFMEGGGWCSSDEACMERAYGQPGHRGHPWLGSSIAWPNTYVIPYEGSELFADPAFTNHSIVFAPYCDGGSWTGDATEAVNTTMGPIYYRGRRLLDALLDSVLEAGLSNATHLLWAGCSAGGLTTYLHADYVASRTSEGTMVLGLADAMYSLNHKPFPGSFGPTEPTFPQDMAWGYTAWNATGGINPACLEFYGLANGWKCLFGANMAPHVQTPLFVLNSKFDTWQAGAIVGANTSVEKADKPLQEFWLAYAAEMAANFTSLPSRHGGFLTNCPAHCQTGRATHGHDPAHRTPDPWQATTVNGIAMGRAFGQWYEHRAHGGTEAGFRWLAAATDQPTGNDTCGYW